MSKLTESKINKILDKMWDEFPYKFPKIVDMRKIVKVGGGFIDKRKGKYYKMIDCKYERVYKKYGYRPKPKEK